MRNQKQREAGKLGFRGRRSFSFYTCSRQHKIGKHFPATQLLALNLFSLLYTDKLRIFFSFLKEEEWIQLLAFPAGCPFWLWHKAKVIVVVQTSIIEASKRNLSLFFSQRRIRFLHGGNFNFVSLNSPLFIVGKY